MVLLAVATTLPTPSKSADTRFVNLIASLRGGFFLSIFIPTFLYLSLVFFWLLKKFPFYKASSSFGVLYVATGKNFLIEAIRSVQLSKKYNPDLRFAVCTDDTTFAVQSSVFDLIIPHPGPSYSYRDKISGMMTLPYDLTLFLDTDACLISNINSLKTFSSSFDLSACYAPVRHPQNLSPSPLSSVPMCFSEINSGVLMLRKSRIVRKLLDHWLTNYDKLFLQYQQ